MNEIKEKLHHNNTIFTKADENNATVIMYETYHQNKATVAFYNHLNILVFIATFKNPVVCQ